MICPLCTGAHHAMACPSNSATLLAIGVRPWPLYTQPVPTEDAVIRPWLAVRPRFSLVENIMAASGASRQVMNSSRHLRAVG